MAAHYSHGTGIIRFYPPGKCYQNRDPFDGVVSVKWLDDHTVLLEAALGNDGADRLQEAIEAVRKHGATRIRTKRSAKHRMPQAWRVVERDELENVWELTI